jgi:hypothetical protein
MSVVRLPSSPPLRRFVVDVGRITSAVSYYGDYGPEIEGEIVAVSEAD